MYDVFAYPLPSFPTDSQPILLQNLTNPTWPLRRALEEDFPPTDIIKLPVLSASPEDKAWSSGCPADFLRPDSADDFLQSEDLRGEATYDGIGLT